MPCVNHQSTEGAVMKYLYTRLLDWSTDNHHVTACIVCIHRLYQNGKNKKQTQKSLSEMGFKPWTNGPLILCVTSRPLSQLDALIVFLGHLSTKCSGWAIVTGLVSQSYIELLHWRKTSSDFLPWTANGNLTKLNRNSPWVVFYQSCSNGSDWLHK